jgi:hypothetical protein
MFDEHRTLWLCDQIGWRHRLRNAVIRRPGAQLASSMLRRTVAASRGTATARLPAFRCTAQTSQCKASKQPVAKQCARHCFHVQTVASGRICILATGSRHAWQRHAAQRQIAAVTAATSAAASSPDGHSNGSEDQAASQADSSIAGAFRQSVARLDGATSLPVGLTGG